FATLSLKEPNKDTVNERNAKLALLSAKIEKLEAAISARSAEFRALTTPITIDNVQKKIPTNATLVEFIYYAPYDPNTFKYGSLHIAVYLLNHDGDLHYVDL